MIYTIFSKLLSSEQNNKNTKNRVKKFYISVEDAEKEEMIKRRKESMCLFSILYKVDPTVVDECTEQVMLERIEEKRFRSENKKKGENEKLESMSTHAIGALKPVAIVRFSQFITVHVKNYFSTARKISYFCLFRGKGDGSIKPRQFLCKWKKFFRDRTIKNEPEWNLPKIDLNELKKFGEQGIQYNRENLETIPVDGKRVFKMKRSEDEDEEIDVMGDDVMKEIF